ncbi:hypothetical protein [Streptomyces sp. NPDC051776]|uniref:hypothetical protein n=1 Tax=Streptomyces sp. NPDC051776 TaxID=3155414 RepID=UPI00341B25D0
MTVPNIPDLTKLNAHELMETKLGTQELAHLGSQGASDLSRNLDQGARFAWNQLGKLNQQFSSLTDQMERATTAGDAVERRRLVQELRNVRGEIRTVGQGLHNIRDTQSALREMARLRASGGQAAQALTQRVAALGDQPSVWQRLVNSPVGQFVQRIVDKARGGLTQTVSTARQGWNSVWNSAKNNAQRIFQGLGTAWVWAKTVGKNAVRALPTLLRSAAGAVVRGFPGGAVGIAIALGVVVLAGAGAWAWTAYNSPGEPAKPPNVPGPEEPGRNQPPPGEQPPAEQPPPGEQQPGEQPPGQQPGEEPPPGEQPPAEQPPPGEQPPAEQPPPGEEAPAEEPPPAEQPPAEPPPPHQEPAEPPPPAEPPAPHQPPATP